jgi:tetratricopeptide (TPR) repeat protein
MSDVPQSLQRAVTLHRGGQLEQARQLYEQIIEQDPRHANALNLLGLVGWQTGHFAEAVEYLQRAIALDASQAAYFGNLAEARRGLGQLPEAIECYREAARLQGGVAVVHLNLGVLLQQTGQIDEAIVNYRRALALAPQKVPARYHLGAALAQQGQLDAAGTCYEQVLELEPNHVQSLLGLAGIRKKQGNLKAAAASYERALSLDPANSVAHFHLGNVRQRERRFADAVACYRKALEISPDDAGTICNLGNALHEMGQLDEAFEYAQRAAEMRPHSAVAQSNLGANLQDLGRLDEAQLRFGRAIELEPDRAEFHHNLGSVLRDQGQATRAIEEFDRALELQAEFPQAHCSRGTALLTLGEFGPGWAEYEYRIGLPQYDTCSFPQPRWDGTPLQGRTLLIHCEQGRGDTFQFIRFVKLARERAGNGKVIVAAQQPLVPLLAGSGYSPVVTRDPPLPHFDVHVPLMSLPLVLGIALENLPHEVPYLAADPKGIEHWRKRLEANLQSPRSGLFLVGICWQGRPEFRFDRLRSIPLASFAPLAAVPGVRLISLQKGPGVDQLGGPGAKFPIVDLGDDFDRDAAFLDAAAVMNHLDLVISSDTAIAHLAGALGVRVWAALSLAPDWRWLFDREDSPWYPTMRLFRQERLGDWSGAFERMAGELRKLASTTKVEDRQ